MSLGKAYFFSLFVIYNLIFVQSDKYRLPDNVKPRLYKLFLNPDLTAETANFDGSVTIVVDVLSRTKNLTLHSSNLMINNSEITLSNKTNKFLPIYHDIDDDVTEFLIIHFEDDLHPGEYELALKFHGNLSLSFKGFYRGSYWDEENGQTFYAMTHFEPTYARRAFPCWDEPALKANFEINIKHFPNYTALSNMPIQRQMKRPLNDGKIWTQFQQTPLISTHNVAFTISDFKNITNKYGNYSVWTRKHVPEDNTKFGFEVGLKAFKIFENFTGIPYPFPKVDIFIVSESYFQVKGRKGYPGLIIFDDLFYLTRNDTPKVILQMTGYNICNAVIYQWIGNLVSPAWWSDLWITVGLSRYLRYFVFNEIKLEGISDMPHLREENESSYSLEEENDCQDENDFQDSCSALYRKISDASRVFEQVSTLDLKPPIIFNMLSSVISREVFNKAVKIILQEYQFKSITTDQFLEVIQQTMNNSTAQRDEFGAFDVKAFILPYITQVGYPVINVLRSNENSTIKLTQECSASQRNDSTKPEWTVPITFTTESMLDFSLKRSIRFLYPSNETLVLHNVKSSDWIIFNIQSIGYYRVNYDNETWLQLANYMNSKNFIKIHPENRLKLLDDASWFVYKGKMSINMFYNILSYCKRERDSNVWLSLPSIIRRIVIHVDVNALDVYSNLLNPTIEEMKLENDDYEIIVYLTETLKHFNNLYKDGKI